MRVMLVAVSICFVEDFVIMAVGLVLLLSLVIFGWLARVVGFCV